jgi:DNA-binding PucR family transcriptional regulator
LDDLLTEVSREFEQGIPALAEGITSRVRNEVDELSRLDTPEVWEAHKQVTIGGRSAQARSLRNGRSMPTYLRESDLEAVRLAVHAGVSLSATLHAYRIGHDASLEAWLDAVDRVPATEQDRSATTRAVVRFAVDYDDSLARLIETEYEAEHSRVLGSPDRARLQAMRDLVAGVTDRAPTLDYDLDVEHIGLIAWGDGADAALQSLARSLDARLISAPTPAGFRWAWLGSRSFDTDTRERLRHLAPQDGSKLAIGQPDVGIEGFRRTHRQAGAAHVVATRKPQPLTLYRDVAVEALALRDESAAREFVSSVLTGIGGEERRSQQLRATLRAYFQSEQNASATAAALGVHDATIARHLTEVEDRIGGRVNNRRVELEMALRLNSLFTGE